MIKVLIVEDDVDMLDIAAYVLRRARFVVIEASDGAQALRRWKADRPDIVVLDLGLPGLDGFEVLRRIRTESETPVLVVTGRRDAQDVLRAFNLGTDDFIPKPVEFRELIARIRAVLRRASAVPSVETEPRVEISGLALDPEAYEVTWRDSLVRLTPTEFRILYLLATNAGHVVSANRLFAYVWASDGGDANALRSHISHLRRKLESDGNAPATISAVPAVGYLLRPAAIQTSAAPVLSPAPMPAPSEPVPAASSLRVASLRTISTPA